VATVNLGHLDDVTASSLALDLALPGGVLANDLRPELRVLVLDLLQLLELFGCVPSMPRRLVTETDQRFAASLRCSAKEGAEEFVCQQTREGGGAGSNPQAL